MDFVTYQFESPSQFFAELDDLLEQSGFHDGPENQVDAYISLMVHFQDEFLDGSVQEVAQCCYRLFDSPLYQQNTRSILWRVTDRAIQSQDHADMWITYQLLLHAGKESTKAFHWMLRSEFFAKLKYQIIDMEGDRLQLLAIHLVYEICRVQTIKAADLALVDEMFINYLLDLVERTRRDEDEILNYATIKLLLAFNEQFMLQMNQRSHDTHTAIAHDGSAPTRTKVNLLLAILTERQGTCSTFGENIIFILNRAEETSLRMLILKLLYLVFTAPRLYEFFYTNDLHVLVDVMIRELWDLPEEEESLRHAYLRVMGPLLTNTQLRRATYKRAEIVRVLRELGGGDLDSALKAQLQERQNREQQRYQLLHHHHLHHHHHPHMNGQGKPSPPTSYRDRQGSVSSVSSMTTTPAATAATLKPTTPNARWRSDRSGCTSPVLAAETDTPIKQQQTSYPKKKKNSNASLLSVSGEQQQYFSGGLGLGSPPTEEFDEADGPTTTQSRDSGYQSSLTLATATTGSSMKRMPRIRAASPTTQRLVERVLREWLDNEMAHGQGTTGVGLSVRDVTDVVVVK
ncbi:hypothetical protein DFQ27_008497 [Actinomortierella ambigua]|uniref:SPIN90/Ldb17 leucine-rich domain-containing protein n=1 Tax=Actinomortierella ambigua TaxID=1343610 RepID=A0A9P6PSL9_9FUNG|nr:hypothetical protein DFQ27_008497 [Actinomortierella ambigua]